MVEVDLPGVDSVREITWNAFVRSGVHIKVPGKYKIKISLIGDIVEVVSSIWNPRTQTLTYTLQTVYKPQLNRLLDWGDDEDDNEGHVNLIDGSVVYDKLVKSSNTLNV